MKKWKLILLFFVLGIPAFSQFNLSAYDFYTMMDTCDNLVLLDIRLENSYNKERIPGAIYAGEKKVLFSLIDSLDKNIPLLLYCDYGKRSKTVVNILQSKGFKNIYHLKRGFDLWKKENYPVDRSPIHKK